jgi:uncharacterized CHY-type Zn-finger protein
MTDNENLEKFYCSVCGREITKEEYLATEMCEECTEEYLQQMDYP